MNIIQSDQQYKDIISYEDHYILYFSDGTCNVGNAVEPQVYEMVRISFPKLKTYTVLTSLTPEIGAQLSVFAIPTVLVYFDKKLSVQKSRVFSISELENEISRYYRLVFDD
ncbi:MAG: thioredoxin [Bacteroidetes bacterium HGW-Bacteroidetes-21]|nr:MAG: thioredoxin [Bacteroidetes bacterium HGW-Bacteroidetes-21]